MFVKYFDIIDSILTTIVFPEDERILLLLAIPSIGHFMSFFFVGSFTAKT